MRAEELVPALRGVYGVFFHGCLQCEIFEPAIPQDLVDPAETLEFPTLREIAVRAFDEVGADTE